MAIILAATGAMADELTGCDSRDPELRIAACTALIDAPGTAAAVRAEALFLRGLSYLELGQYQHSLADYDEAIRISPQFAAALNNRAMVWLRLGKPEQGMLDIERALAIEPRHPIFVATRGQIGQSLGDRQGAMRDHQDAMTIGGPRFVRYYQCGLRRARLYDGPLDGVVRPELMTALRACVDQGISCDPIPSTDSECPDPVG
jgi:tetratricopeptide (TPR) repeat protein